MTVVDLCTSSSHALYFYQVLWNYLKRYQSYRADTISIPKISKGNNSAKNVGGVTVVDLCTSSGHALYFYQVLWNYLKRYQSYRADTISILKITKGNNSAKNVGGVTVVDLCTSSGHALYFYQVLWNYLKRYQSYRADTISIPKISKGNNSAKNVGGVTVLISARRLIMLYICAKFREIILNGIKVIERTRMINRWRTDGRTDGRTDTQKFGGYNIIPRHFLWRGIITESDQSRANHQLLQLCTVSTAWSDSDQAVRAVHNCKSWFPLKLKSIQLLTDSSAVVQIWLKYCWKWKGHKIKSTIHQSVPLNMWAGIVPISVTWSLF